MTEKYKVYRKRMNKEKEIIYDRLCNYYKIDKPYCMFCGNQVKEKRDCSKEEISGGQYLCIDHKQEILSGKKLNELHGTNLFKWLYKNIDNENILSQFQFLCDKCNRIKAKYYSGYLYLESIKKHEEASESLNIFERMAHFKNYKITKMKKDD